MNRPTLYQRTVDILYEAYFRGELMHGYCHACAVGNICKEASVITGVSNTEWSRLFMSVEPGNQLRANDEVYVGYFGATLSADNKEAKQLIINAKKLISATGYQIDELAAIERAFESAPKGSSDEDWMFNGLVAVLEVLKQIHQVEDNQADVTRFRNHYQTKI